ncbi:MAG: transglutaminase-like domain-containing protein [Planctomycetaceae bacterium]
MKHTRAVILTIGLSLICSVAELRAQSPRLIAKTPGTPARNTTSLNQQHWYRIEFNDKTVGYESLTTTLINPSPQATANPPGLVRRIRDTHLKLRRFGTDLSVSAHLETIESSDGMLQSWSLRRTSADGAAVERSGRWNGEKSAFELTESAGGAVRREMLTSLVQPRSAIFPGWLPAASTGVQRLWTSAVLFPETSAIVDVEIERGRTQSLQLADGTTIAVVRYNFWPTSHPEMKSSVYYNSEMIPVRIEQPLIGQTLRLDLTDAANALGQDSMESLDLQLQAALPVKRQLTNLDNSPSLSLKVAVGSSEQIDLPTSEFQTVEQIAPNELLVVLHRPVMPATAGTEYLSNPRKPMIDPAYTSSSRWMTTEDDNLKRMGIIAAGATSVPIDKCRRLTQYVWKHLRTSPFSTSMQPASQILKTMQGDCTEHAVLLSALMRCQGIPSRVVIGFIYVPNPSAFMPHMWTEAFVDGKWIPFDSTRGPIGIGVTHLKVADSVLSDDVGSGTTLFIPLLSFLGRATVDAVVENELKAN